MSATKHTSGPWLRDTQSGINCDVRAASGRKVALCWGLSACNTLRPAYRAECDANAHLIAAAPELLEALIMVRDADDDCRRDGLPTIPRAARAKIDAAINKATGESS